ncbi:hypothetical protein ACNBFH_004431 [Salmonella enterica subsp. enterica serovar Bareilly]
MENKLTTRKGTYSIQPLNDHEHELTFKPWGKEQPPVMLNRGTEDECWISLHLRALIEHATEQGQSLPPEKRQDFIDDLCSAIDTEIRDDVGILPQRGRIMYHGNDHRINEHYRIKCISATRGAYQAIRGFGTKPDIMKAGTYAECKAAIDHEVSIRTLASSLWGAGEEQIAHAVAHLPPEHAAEVRERMKHNRDMNEAIARALHKI